MANNNPFARCCTTPAGVAVEDKPKIAFYAAMMMIQNFGFFVMYYNIFGDIEGTDTCANLKFWVGFFALDCFVESFVCVWMGMAGFTNNATMFKVMWIVHLLVALPYVLCTITIPLAMFSDDGAKCIASNEGPMFRLEPTYWAHCGLFMVYVWMMLAITYYSFLKPSKVVNFGDDSAKASAIGVLDNDKPKIAINAVMMTIQNFGFFVMYYTIFGYLPADSDCTDLRFWVGFFALDCFVESFVCVWMAMGGYTNDSGLFKAMWILHLLVALPYVLCTITIPMAIYSEKGEKCIAANAGPLYSLKPTYWVHCALFMVYVWMMLYVTFFSFIKPTFYSDTTDEEKGLLSNNQTTADGFEKGDRQSDSCCNK